MSGVAPVAAGLAAGIAFVVAFSVFAGSVPQISVVIIPERSSLATGPGYEPETIRVQIGVNSTVRWINQDTVPHGIVTPDNLDDQDFAAAVEQEKEEHPFLMPGESFEHTFTRAGEFGYHMEPHPWMKGTVIVMPDN